MCVCDVRIEHIKNPTMKVIAVTTANGRMSFSWYIAHVTVGTSMNAASIISSQPVTLSNIGKFMIGCSMCFTFVIC
jgi:peptidoglycan/LPS O-acetylase OafA/YrhL